jgi:hypothetical protein
MDVHECTQGFLDVNKNYSTCILFLPSEVTKELVKTMVDMKLLSQSTTTTMLLHLTHTTHHTCSRIHAIITSTKEQGKNMHLLIHHEHDK